MHSHRRLTKLHRIFRDDVDKTKPLLTIGGFTVADHWVDQFHNCKEIGPIVSVLGD